MTLSPIDELAVSLPTTNGAFAVLLGSGVSRAAGISTGYEVMQELLTRLAGVVGAGPTEDVWAWYHARYHQEPTYSSVLKLLSPSQEGRQQLLHPYFEPVDGEPPGTKEPTRAHKAVAQLVKAGHVRVILTTNFDRLMENALRELNIEPHIVATSSECEQLRRLDSQRCVLIKLHGDFKNPETLNTDEELKDYHPSRRALVDRVARDYHFIIAGWSADHDVALVDSLKRCRTGRGPRSFWLYRSNLSGAAKSLADQINAQLVQAPGADEFFESLEKKVRAWESVGKAKTNTDEVFLAEVRRIVKLDRPQVEFHELMMTELQSFKRAMEEPDLYVDDRMGDDPCLTAAMYVRLMKTARRLRILAAYGTFYVQDAATKAIKTTFEAMVEPVNLLGEKIQRASLVPAQSVLAAVGIASVAVDDYRLLASLQQTEVRPGDAHVSGLARKVMIPVRLYNHTVCLNHNRPDPLGASVFVYESLREEFRHLVVSDRQYEKHFDRYEILATLAKLMPIAPEGGHESGDEAICYGLGAYAIDDNIIPVREYPAVRALTADLLKHGRSFKPLSAGLCFGDEVRMKAALDSLTDPPAAWRGLLVAQSKVVRDTHAYCVTRYRTPGMPKPTK